jgi:hypothetical protein
MVEGSQFHDVPSSTRLAVAAAALGLSLLAAALVSAMLVSKSYNMHFVGIRRRPEEEPRTQSNVSEVADIQDASNASTDGGGGLPR